jgi:DNA-binding beta-propeller fold protein YncE
MVGRDPTAMAITPDGKTLYVAGANINLASGWVTPISVADDEAAPSIQVKAWPSSPRMGSGPMVCASAPAARSKTAR